MILILMGVLDYVLGWRGGFFHLKYLAACYWHRYYQLTLWRIQ